MSDNKKNWYENYKDLQLLYEETEGLTAFPTKWNELYEWFNKIDNNIHTTALVGLIQRIQINDLMCKNNARNLLAEKGILPKRAFDELWNHYRVNVFKYEKEEKEEDTPLLSIIVAEKPRGGVYKLLSTKEGIIYRQIKRYKIKNTDEFYEINFDQPILDVTLNLNELYLTQNEQRFYDVKIGKEDVCLSKNELLDFIENERNYAYVSGKDLKNYISIILRGYEKKYKLNPTPMYPTIGIFRKQNGDFEITYPGIKEIKLYGENDYQKRIIAFCEKKGIDIKGELTNPFYEIVYNDTLPLSVRLITSGYIAIEPFFYALKDDLDVFPNLFWIAPQGTGKTTFFELMGNIIYGTELKNADDVNSQPRLTKIPTSHTTPLLIDDMDKLGNIQMSFIKSISTRKKGRERMTSKQKVIIEPVYASFMGTANDDDFIQGEENIAFRVRALILRDFKKIEINKEMGFKKFNENIKKINLGKIFGYYLLKNALDFIKEIDNSIEDTPYEKLTSFIENIKNRLVKYLSEKCGNDYIDPRRITIYSLILTGLYFWRYIFNKHELNVDILSKVIAFEENDIFLKFIIDLEGIEQLFSLQDFEKIIDFYENPRYDFKKYYNKDKEIVIGSDFIHAYDKWARERGYETLEHLTTIANMESRILLKRIETKIKRIFSQDSLTPYKKPVRGVILYINEIREKMRFKEEEEDKINDKKDVITGRDEREVKELDTIVGRIYEIFEKNNNKALEEQSLIQVLEIDFSKNLIEKAIKLQIENKNLIKTKEDYLKLDGEVGGFEEGDI